jgi:uncharacterized protein
MIPRFTPIQTSGRVKGRTHRWGSAAGIRRVARTWLGALGMALVLLSAGTAAAQEVPALKERVNDYAGLLSAAVRRQVEATLGALEQTDSTQIVVLTVSSLGGDTIEDFSLRVADTWKIGHKGLDNGAILVIAKQERQLRIEVGYGLEGKLTDLMAGRIIREVIAPRFKAGQFDQGVVEGVEAMVEVVRGEFMPPARFPQKGLPRHALAFALFAFIFLVSMLGRISLRLAAAGGALAAPLLGITALGMGFPAVLALFPIGLVVGIFLSLLAPAMAARAPSNRRGHYGGGPWLGGGFGGGGSGGWGGGGFSGGGGGFGGGGASGSW